MTRIRLSTLDDRTALYKTDTHLTQLKKQLRYQKNPLGILPLYRVFIDDASHFAAVILWLLHCNIPIKMLIKTDLLQSYMAYHISFLDAPDSPIHELYTILFNYPAAFDLIQAAEKIPCLLRGFRGYALTGDRLPAEIALQRPVSERVMTIELSPTVENFESLRALVGDAFWIEALQFCIDSHSKAGKALLYDSFNNTPTSLTFLPALINRVAKEPSRCFMIASLLSDQTVMALIALKSGAVFHLLPYKPIIKAHLPQLAIKSYVKQLRRENEAMIQSISQLYELVDALIQTNTQPQADFVYHALLECMLEYPSSFEDSHLLIGLKRYDKRHQIIAHIAQRLDYQFLTSMNEVLAEPHFTNDHYQQIKGFWRTQIRQHELLSCLSRVQAPLRYPTITRLQEGIASKRLEQQGQAFNIIEYASALHLAPVFMAEEITDYETFLIHFLVYFVEEPIQAAIIAVLNTNPAVCSRWGIETYGGETLLLKAAKAGNRYVLSQLADWFTAHRWSLPRQHFVEATAMALDRGHLGCVAYCLDAFIKKPPRQLMESIVLSAAKAGETRLLAQICSLELIGLQQSTIDTALEHAVKANHLDTVAFLCSLPPPLAPTEKKRRALSLTASKSGKFDQIQYLYPLVIHVDLAARARFFTLSHHRSPSTAILNIVRAPEGPPI